VDVGGSSLPAVRVDLNPQALFNQGVSLDAVRTGVGDVDVGGSSLPAVRVDLNPQALFNQGVSLDAVRT
ncbi:hypothetical protein CQA88_32185, partial [Klebsiella pneumoniae]